MFPTFELKSTYTILFRNDLPDNLMDAKSMIRLACPLGAVDSQKYVIALKVVQMPVCKNWFQRNISETSHIFSL